MIVRTEATVDDRYRVPEKGKAELVDGRLVHKSPTGGLPGVAGGAIYASLRAYARDTKRGHAIPDNIGFLVKLPRRKSFSPDAAFHVGPLTMKFIEGAPVFAVEVHSEGDYGPAAERAKARKRADYFAAGTLVVWDVDLEGTDVIRSYGFDDPVNPTVFRRGEAASAEPEVPGWTIPGDDFWP